MKSTILLIEDETGIADTITYALSTEGFDPLRAETGRQGLDILRDRIISLVILDIGLPDMNGFDILREIRKSWNVPVLILTARTDEIDRILGLELGGDDYMMKPFSPRELTARIRAILRRTAGFGAPSPSEALTPAFTVDTNRRQISYYGAILPLSRYEYEILCLLIRRPGWVFSREQIMEQIWDEPGESFDRTVDAHIKSIRAKLKNVREDSDPIETHRGVGYALKDTP
ncbi:MAG: two-component system response regulator CreB [Spirochaetae bacterium HGW-Spirochaetae-1]|jgi:two-component system catabolic regulation response regulator CreB|nr:MAG: two-component system response regulator CreB [Spirochaetae bacterium HGW-Spirochaetae-1]